jgi:hypothetical protein
MVGRGTPCALKPAKRLSNGTDGLNRRDARPTGAHGVTRPTSLPQAGLVAQSSILLYLGLAVVLV